MIPQRVWPRLLGILTFLGVVMLTREYLACALETNSILIETTSVLAKIEEPLRVTDLLRQTQRPAQNDCDPILTDLQHLVMRYGRTRQFTALGISQALCGYPRQAEKALQSAGSEPLSMMTLAIVYSQQNRPEKACSVLQELPDSASMLAANGEAAYWAGQRDEALVLLEMSFTLDRTPNRSKAQVYHHLSLLHEQSGNRDEAVKYARLWTIVMPEIPDPNITLAGLYLRTTNVEGAYLVLRQAEIIGARDYPSFPGQMGRVYDLRNDLEQAIPLYREAVNENPQDPFMQWLLGKALYQHGDYQEAIPYLEFAAQSSYPSLQQEARNLLTQIQERLTGDG